ncbi:hypothetical protein GYMLUDRAFT_61877 [Collybiopsis luxurians FD-317 M1]|uniref:DUF6534 domain-containing protein n=1 Tax=Collybiopsis luxurians FD-317 M1 TaxID=944289 RepID=A0A0D0B0N2_9AGAR|nr:hypothetical protein GYMLUDRAFT_61877 [Collybiopsis luxurians FD-317 M1]
MMLFMLRECKKTTYKQTITCVENAIKYIIETGAITVIVMLVELAFFLALPKETYNYVICGKVYANSLLANLKSRITFLSSGTAHLYQSNSDLRSMVNNSLWPVSSDTKQKHESPTTASHSQRFGAQNVVLHSAAEFDPDGAYELAKLEGPKTVHQFPGQDNEV